MDQITLINQILIPKKQPIILQKLLSKKGIQYTTTKIKNSIHIRSTKQGFQLQYQQLKKNQYQINTVFIYFRNKKFNQYNGNLPYHIHLKSTIKSIIMYLGQPSKKSKYLIEIIYDHLGLGIVFQSGNTWHKQDALIQYLYFYEKQGKQQPCSSCLKQIKDDIILNDLSCKQCQLVKYCSKQCFNKHYHQHKIFCQQVD